MRILSSSPYATFIAKEWNLSINSPSLNYPASGVRIKKRCYKNLVKFEIQETSPADLKRSELIQLSFA